MGQGSVWIGQSRSGAISGPPCSSRQREGHLVSRARGYLRPSPSRGQGLSLVFLDTNLFIYLFEDDGERGERVSQLIRRMAERQDRLATSTLTLGEILVKPLEASNTQAATRYEAYFRSPEVQLVPFDALASLRYAEIRHDRTIRPPDAIQLACAAAAGADLFITNDEALTRKKIKGIQFIVTLDTSPI